MLFQNKNKNIWQTFAHNAHVFTPSREEQISSLVSLIPARENEFFTVIDLGAGSGYLSSKILQAYPNVHVIAVDNDEQMLKAAKENLKVFGNRAEVISADLQHKLWFANMPQQVRCFVSSLVFYNLSDNLKKSLFHNLYTLLDAKGAILLVDIIKPVTENIRNYYAELWEGITQEQSREIFGTLDGYQEFKDRCWNYYLKANSNDRFTPASLYDQLQWLEQVGFKKVDCYWLRAGHALFGGYKE